jgi:hypothetical protein
MKPLIKTESSVGSDVSTSCSGVDDPNSFVSKRCKVPTWAKTPQELEKHYDSMITSTVTHQDKYLWRLEGNHSEGNHSDENTILLNCREIFSNPSMPSSGCCLGHPPPEAAILSPLRLSLNSDGKIRNISTEATSPPIICVNLDSKSQKWEIYQDYSDLGETPSEARKSLTAPIPPGQLWEKSMSKVEGCFTLRNPASGKHLCISSTNKLKLQGKSKVTYSRVPNTTVGNPYSFFGACPSYMALFGTTRLLNFKKSSFLHFYSELLAY